MANLVNNTQMKQVATVLAQVQVPIKSGSHIYQGAMVCVLSASGYAVRAGTAATGPVIGVAQAEAATPASDGAVNVNLLTGLFAFPLHATRPPTIANMGQPVYASDDNTLSNTASDGPLAGILCGFEAVSGAAIVFISPSTNAAISFDFVGQAITGALTTVADAAAKAVLTSLLAAFVARGATNSTT